jgi:hypothetical protein
MANESRINPTVHNSLTILAGIYNMDKRTFNELNRPIWHLIKTNDPDRRILHSYEILTITDNLGRPDIDYCFGVDPLVYRTTLRIAMLYKVSRKTMTEWINKIPNVKPCLNPHKPGMIRRFFTPKEVRRIIEHLGVPDIY